MLVEIATATDPTGAYLRGRLSAARTYRDALKRDREIMLRVVADAIGSAEAEIRMWEGRLQGAATAPADGFEDWPVTGEAPELPDPPTLAPQGGTTTSPTPLLLLPTVYPRR